MTTEKTDQQKIAEMIGLALAFAVINRAGIAVLLDELNAHGIEIDATQFRVKRKERVSEALDEFIAANPHLDDWLPDFKAALSRIET